jgi:hypothetical protein
LTEFAWVCVRVIFLRRGRAVFSSAYLFFFLAALEYYLPGCFHIACHLAAESGTRFFCSLSICHICWGCMIHILGGCFSWEFLIVLFSSYVDDIAFIKI